MGKHLCVGREKLVTSPSRSKSLETPLRRQRKAAGIPTGMVGREKHLCVGREKGGGYFLLRLPVETPLRRQRKGLHAVNSAVQVVVDKNDVIVVGDTLICTLPSGKTEPRTVSAVDGTTITVGTAFSAAPEAESIWAVVNADLQTQTFRVVSVTEGDGSTFDIAAVQNEQSKYAAVDYGSALSDTIITSIPESSVPAFLCLRRGVSGRRFTHFSLSIFSLPTQRCFPIPCKAGSRL